MAKQYSYHFLLKRLYICFLKNKNLKKGLKEFI